MKRIMSILLIAALLLGVCGAPSVFATEASEVEGDGGSQQKQDELQSQLDELESKYADLQERQAAIKAQIASASSLKNQQLAVKATIDEQVSITESKIGLLEEKIAMLEESIGTNEERLTELEAEIETVEADIDAKEQAIVEKQAAYDLTYANFLKRLRVLYMSGGQTELELFLDAASYADALSRAEAGRRIAEHDRTLMAEYTAQREQLEAALEEIERERAELQVKHSELGAIRLDLQSRYDRIESSRVELQTMKDELDEQLAVVAALAQQYANQEYVAKQEEAQVLSAMQDAKAQMNTIFAELARLSKLATYVGGEFQWPLPGYTMITSTFGESRGYYSGGTWHQDIHTGTDISGSGVYGKPIVAANSGVVYAATWSSWGYGNYVIVDHGGGYSTLYGHCSSLAVAKDQTVVQGDVIAYVGSTGNSTGPHLHFEIRIDGKAVNPMNYFTKVGG